MRYRFINIRIVYSFLLLLVVWPGKADCQENESGRYPLYNFTPKDYGQHSQNWCAVQDHRGIMYFGNNSGVLEYDGVYWTLASPYDANPVYSLAVGENGRIFFGSENEFGYLVTDSVGKLESYLLSDMLEEEDRVFYEIWKTHITDEGVIFQAFHHLFIWKNDSLHVIKSEEEINKSFLVGNRVFFSYYDSNLAYLEGNEIVDVNNGEIISSSFIQGMLQTEKNSILIVTGIDGFYELEYENDNPGNSRIRRVRSKNDRLFANRDIYNMQSLGPNRISLGTWGFGAIVIDTLFNVITVFDKEEGLQDQIIQGQFVDEAGHLWLALSKGISRIETNSALTLFNDMNGLEGTVETLTRFGDRIYATTNVGLLYMEQKTYAPGISEYSKPVFKMFPDFDFECWDMIVYREGNEELLLVLTNDEIYEVTKDHRSRSVLNDYPYKLYQSGKDPKRVFVGLESGLKSIYRQGSTWAEEEYIEGVDARITDIYEDGDDLWLGTANEGVLLLQDLSFRRSESPFISRFGEAHGLPEGPFIISDHDDRITVATNKGLFRIDAKDETFYPDTVFGEQFANGTKWIHRINQHSDLGAFMVTMTEELGVDNYDVGYTVEQADGAFDWVNIPFTKVAENPIQAVFIEEGGIVWMGGSEGIYRYEPDNSRNYEKDFNVFVRKVETSEGEVIFGGAYADDHGILSIEQPVSAIYDLPYKKNSLIFTYSAQADEDESFTEFSYFLEGNDKRWSDWEYSPEPKSVYTNLHEGKYTFYVMARNIYGQESSESRYEFTIMAPWFRTTLAYIIYILLAVAVVYVIVVFYTRRLRAIIKDRTAEVVSQKEVIEVKNNELTDSILYAEKIQRAMIPPEDDLAKMNLDGFIFFKPLNIVSGDFYWLSQKDNKLITVAADCTGHGVPGAFMSMLGVAYLNNIVEARGILHAGAILDELRAEVISALKQKGESGEQKDGMDMALHVIDFEKMKMEFAGANNPLVMIRDKELTQYKGDRMPIGIHELADQSFENQEIDIQKGDVFYTFSDGFQDQFGGEKNKKFMIKRLKELFQEIHEKPMSKQKEILEKTFYDWMVPYGVEQIDDVIVIGIRI